MHWKVIMLLLLYSPVLLAQRKITGIIADEVSSKPLPAAITMRNSNGRITNFSSGRDGKYQFEVPAGIDTIFYKKAGYRVNWIVLGPLDPTKEVLNIDIKLLPTDKETLNAIYQQSEQTHTVIEKSTGKTAGQAFVISAVDAVSGESLAAEFALFETSSKKKMRYVTTADKKAFEVVFSQTDIVALEVSSNGYEDYKGNLVINSFGPKKVNSIKLIRGESILNLSITGIEAANGNDIRCTLTSASGLRHALKATNTKYTYSGSIKQVGAATIEIYQAEKLIYSEKIELKRGLNDKKLFINANAASNTPVREATPPADTVIYFNQSAPELRVDAKQVLNVVAAQLNYHNKLKVRLIGHTDNVGVKNRNLILSEYRVKATKQYLIQLGIDEKRILMAWKGGETPAMPNDLEQHKQKNRRVELIFEHGN